MEKLISKNTLYKGKIISLEVNDVLCPNGEKAKREIIRHPGGVCILAEIDGKIAMEEQYRSPYDKVILELPAGKIEKGEDITKAAIRELEEEIGYKASTMIKVGEVYPSVGYTDEVIHLFVAKDLKMTKQNLDSDEDLNVKYYSLDELKIKLQKNEIKDAKTQVLLMKYIIEGGKLS